MTEENQNEGPVVRVGKVTDGFVNVPFQPNMTISEAIDAGGFSIDTQDEVRVNNQPVTNLDDVVPQDAVILIVQAIRGN